jgi:hypothetical protein
MLPARVALGWAVAPALLALSILASPASANCGNDKPVGRPADECPAAPSPSATPELDSLVLLGAGLLGTGGYALTRLRATRRRQ